jgi:hypothetical protein
MPATEAATLSDAALLDALRLACRDAGLIPLRVVERTPNIFASSFPSEIVTFAFSDGHERTLLYKLDDGRACGSFWRRGMFRFSRN